MSPDLLLTVFGWVLQGAGAIALALLAIQRQAVNEAKAVAAEAAKAVHTLELDIARNYATEAQLEKVIDAKLAPINKCLAQILIFLERQNSGLPITPSPPIG